MSNFDQTCERYWPDTRITPGYNHCVPSCQSGSGEGAADVLLASRAKELQVKRLTLACILLSFCATCSVAGPAPQSNRQTSGESRCSAGFKECRESLTDFKEAEQFMQLKATVLADLNWSEKSGPTKPKIATVRDANVSRQKTGNGAVYSATVGPNRISSVQATSAVQPVSLESTAGTPKEIQ
jgi:hypothetical protein